MTFKYAVSRNGVLLDRAKTEAGAGKIAAKYIGAVVVASLFITGCANSQHGGLIPCDADNCGKIPTGVVR